MSPNRKLELGPICKRSVVACASTGWKDHVLFHLSGTSTYAINRELLTWRNTLPYRLMKTILLNLRHRSIWLQYRGASRVRRWYVQASRRSGGLGFSICVFSHYLFQRDCFYGREAVVTPREVNVQSQKPRSTIDFIDRRTVRGPSMGSNS